MDTLIDDQGVTYIFDRGYVDYDKFNEYSLNGIFFVTRLKDNAVMETLHEFDLGPDSPISSDRMVKLGQGKKQTRMVFRVIETLDLKGNRIQILSNRFDLTAEEIGDLYRNRWKIETFFRWIKQHLKLTRFYGEQEQAVWNQIWMCLIAYALLLLTKMELETNKSLREVARLLHVMKYRSWEAFREVIHRKPLRRSKGRQKVAR